MVSVLDLELIVTRSKPGSPSNSPTCDSLGVAPVGKTRSRVSSKNPPPIPGK